MYIQKNHRIIFQIATLLLIFYAACIHIFNIEPFIALRGFSALDFSNTILHPENFVANYPGGAETIRNSILPWIYPLLMKWGIPFELLLRGMIFFEISVLCFGVFTLAKTIAPHAHPITYFILVSLFVLSSSRTPNLAGFGNPFFHGQFYGFADGLGLFAIAKMIQKKYILATITILLSLMIHPLITAFAFSFMMAYQLVSDDRNKWMNVVKQCALVGIFGLMWYELWLKTSTSPMTVEDFFQYSYLFNYHWFPQDLKLFTSEHARFATPFLSAILLGLIALFKNTRFQFHKKAFLAGILSLVLLSCVGCLAGYFEVVPFLIKACLQRSSVLLLSIMVILITITTLDDLHDYLKNIETTSLINEKSIFAYIGLFCIASTYYPVYWPVAPIFLYSFFYVYQTTKSSQNLFSITAITSVLLFGFYELYLLLTHQVSVHYYIPQFRQLIRYSFIFFLIAYLIKVIRKRSPFDVSIENYLLLAFFLTLTVSWASRFLEPSQNPDYIAQNKDYKAVQLWAKKNTPVTALFMPDPTRAYGWRDFSERSSTGTLHEWLNSAWIYNTDNHSFLEGKERTLTLLNDPNFIPLKHAKEQVALMIAINTKALQNFYDPSGKILLKMAEKYHIDYFIFEKAHAKNYGGIPKWEIAYTNPNYVVLRPIPIS